MNGEVENRTAARLFEEYIRRVPGVVNVESKLTSSIDDQARRTATSAERLQTRV